jgi:hypothetical protein
VLADRAAERRRRVDRDDLDRDDSCQRRLNLDPLSTAGFQGSSQHSW